MEFFLVPLKNGVKKRVAGLLRKMKKTTPFRMISEVLVFLHQHATLLVGFVWNIVFLQGGWF